MFIKHVGKHNNRKVAIVFREVPGEDHMCLVIYPDVLPVAFHDSIMKVLESQSGQQSDNLGDVLFRSLLPDGRAMLGTLHKEGMIKKVQSSQVIITPNANTRIRLDELNSVLKQMQVGEEAVKKMEQLDMNSGLIDPKQRQAMVVNKSAEGVLSDSELAAQLIQQAQKMELEAKSLLSESERIKKEAYQLDTSLKPTTKRTKKTHNEEKIQ